MMCTIIGDNFINDKVISQVRNELLSVLRISDRIVSPIENFPGKDFYLSGWAGIRSTIYRTETFVHESTIQPAEY